LADCALQDADYSKDTLQAEIKKVAAFNSRAPTLSGGTSEPANYRRVAADVRWI